MAYIYTHETDAGEIFYVGKGTGDRAYKMEGHNPYWERTVAKHGKVVRILEDDLTDEVAFAKEVALIEEIGLDNLTNITEGGEGFTSEQSKAQLKKLWQDPAYQKMKSDKMSEQSKAFWQDPAYAKMKSEKMTEQMKKQWQDPAFAKMKSEKMSEQSKALWKDPAFAKMQSEKMSEQSKEQWKDPAYRKMMSEQSKKTKPCPNCGKQLNAGNMARHLKAKANTCRG
jgi:hypothetical protein